MNFISCHAMPCIPYLAGAVGLTETAHSPINLNAIATVMDRRYGFSSPASKACHAAFLTGTEADWTIPHHTVTYHVSSTSGDLPTFYSCNKSFRLPVRSLILLILSLVPVFPLYSSFLVPCPRHINHLQ
jgi:hypothetical protein